MKTKLQLKTSDKLWKRIRLFQVENDYKTVNEAVNKLLEKGLEVKA